MVARRMCATTTTKKCFLCSLGLLLVLHGRRAKGVRFAAPFSFSLSEQAEKTGSWLLPFRPLPARSGSQVPFPLTYSPNLILDFSLATVIKVTRVSTSSPSSSLPLSLSLSHARARALSIWKTMTFPLNRNANCTRHPPSILPCHK